MGDRTNPIKFGPEWLRNLPGAGSGAGGGAGGGASGGTGGGTGAVAGGSGTRPSPHGTTPSKVLLAKLRYGREEMLALYDRDAVEPPEQLKVIEVLYQPRGKPPYALNNTFEDDTNTGRVGGTSIGVAGGGLGGSVAGLGAVGGAGRGRGAIAADVRGTRPMGGDRTRSRPMYRQTSVGRAAPWHQRGYEEEPRLWSNGGAGGGGVLGSRTNGADPPDWPPKLGTYRSKRTANTNWRQQAGGREDVPPTDEWRSPENAGSRRQDKWPSMPGGDREWTHSSRRTWAAADSADDALPEWALGENSEACAGTFDSSGAFHGYSNDDSDLPKSQESPYPLTRSHTHGAFSRSRTVDEGSDEWWASEKAKKLSPKRFMMEAGEGKGTGAGPGTGANTGAGGEAWSPAVDRESPPDARAQPEPRADRGDFKSVMIPTNNALRQKHQSIGSPTDTPTRRSVPPPLATSAPLPVVTDPPPLAAPAPAQSRAPLIMHHHQLHSDEEKLKEKETNKLVEDILDMNLDEQLRPAVRAGVGGATNDVLAAMFGSRYGPGPGVAVAEAELADRWYYEDPKRTIQGPFSSKEMYGWYKAGFFGPTLMVRRACDPAMRPLATYGHMPFGHFEPFPTYDLRRDPIMPTTPHLPLDVESLWSGGGVSGPGELMWLQRPGLAAPLPGPLPTPLPPPLPTPMSAPLPVPLPAPPSSSEARLSQLPLYFWEHQQPAIPSNVRLPEEIAKEMKTEEQILAQLRAAQSKLPGPPMSTMSSDCIAPPMPPVPAPLPAPPSAPTSTILHLPITPLPLPLPLSLADIPPPPPPTLAEQKARLPNTKPAKQPAKDVDKPTKTKDNTNAKTKSKKSKEEKKEESEPKEDDRESTEDRDRVSNNEISPRNDEKLNKRDIEKEKKEWIKDGFTVVKGGERGKRRADETRPPAAIVTADEPEQRDRGDRKRKEEEKASQIEDDKKKRQTETVKKQQQATSGGGGGVGVAGGTTTSTGATRRLAWNAAAGGGPPAAVPTLADIQRLERENRQAAREHAPPAPTPPQPVAPAQPAPAPWAATGDTASNAAPSQHRPADETHDGGFWEGPSGRNMGGAGRDDATEFETWCITTLAGWRDLELDGPTFVTFLKDVESPFEVKEYVKCYLGESREATEFARAFLERRRRGGGGSGSAGGSGVRPPPAPADDLCAPAAAVTPALESRAGAARNQRKHKKNRMLKVDARILGFSVTAAEDRINVGDIDTA